MLDTKEGIQISMHDMNGNHEWRFKYRFWPNNSSRMYVLESTGDFVNAHDLVPGDYILVYQNFEDGKYVIEAMKEDEFEEPPAPACNNKDPVINEPANPETDLEFPELPELPDMETFFAYDTTYLDDSPLEYQGGTIDFPRIESDLPFDVNYTDRLL
ncbi:hypothetical protein ACJIZ3_018239 [Penstemon smallii]|uniref:TF-B3 domain-containing protein n=1 Tax=Penstemon smallii TaxID=265156 RepID=A0ABD3SXW1_9LAMI